MQLTLAELLFDVQPTLGGNNVAIRQAQAVCKVVIGMCDRNLGARDIATNSARTRALLLYARCILRCASRSRDTLGDARRMLLCAAASASGIPVSLDCPPKISRIVVAHHKGDIVWFVYCYISCESFSPHIDLLDPLTSHGHDVISHLKVRLFTVTVCANPANDLTCPPLVF